MEEAVAGFIGVISGLRTYLHFVILETWEQEALNVFPSPSCESQFTTFVSFLFGKRSLLRTSHMPRCILAATALCARCV